MMGGFLLAAVLILGAAGAAQAERRSHRSFFDHHSAQRVFSTDSNLLQCINSEIVRIKDEHCAGVDDKQLGTLTENIRNMLETLFQDRETRLLGILKQELLQVVQSSQKEEDCQSCLAQILPYLQECQRKIDGIKAEFGKQVAVLMAGMAEQAAMAKASMESSESFRRSFKATLKQGFDRLQCVAPVIEKTGVTHGSQEWVVTQPPVRGGRKHRKG